MRRKRLFPSLVSTTHSIDSLSHLNFVSSILQLIPSNRPKNIGTSLIDSTILMLTRKTHSLSYSMTSPNVSLAPIKMEPVPGPPPVRSPVPIATPSTVQSTTIPTLVGTTARAAPAPPHSVITPSTLASVPKHEPQQQQSLQQRPPQQTLVQSQQRRPQQPLQRPVVVSGSSTSTTTTSLSGAPNPVASGQVPTPVSRIPAQQQQTVQSYQHQIPRTANPTTAAKKIGTVNAPLTATTTTTTNVKMNVNRRPQTMVHSLHPGNPAVKATALTSIKRPHQVSHARPPLTSSTPLTSTNPPTTAGTAVASSTTTNVTSSTITTKSSKKKKTTVTMATAQTATPATTQGENTGRWTADEHRLFLQGLEQHGKGWKKIASLIKSRTVVQIRTHAQKYFQKLAKARQNGEEGDVSMENRERTSLSTASKRRRGGTKRKAIQSVVASAEREGKRRATEATAKKMASSGGGANANSNATAQGQQHMVTLPTVTPSLAPFVYPAPMTQQPPIAPHPTGSSAPSSYHQPILSNSNNNVNPTSDMYHNNHRKGAVALSAVPSITTAHGTISGAALEDSL